MLPSLNLLQFFPEQPLFLFSFFSSLKHCIKLRVHLILDLLNKLFCPGSLPNNLFNRRFFIFGSHHGLCFVFLLGFLSLHHELGLHRWFNSHWFSIVLVEIRTQKLILLVEKVSQMLFFSDFSFWMEL